jgi:uncharacterized protein (DUF697 family)
MYFALARSVVTDREQDKVIRQVERLRARYPEEGEDRLVARMIRQTALRCAAVGAIASAPSELLAFVPLAADFSYQVLALNRLVLSIAFVYEGRASGAERGASAAASLAVGGGGELLRRSAVGLVRRALRRRAASAFLPVAGAAVGGALAYAAARSAGKLAQQFYSERHGGLSLTRLARFR